MEPQPKLQIVSGKGGVGKSLVAAALAASKAAQGLPTLLVSFDETSAVNPYLGQSARYQPQQVAPQLWLSRVDARQALAEYVRRKMTLSLLYEGLLANPVIAGFFDALPLFGELMSLGKLLDLTTDSKSPYAHVVFDAPATGHCKILLNVPQVAANTLVAGPVYSAAQDILQMLRDPQLTELLIVTLPEETPIREALELHLYAHEEAQIAAPRMIVNRVVQASLGSAPIATVRSAAQRHPELGPVLAALTLESEIAAEQEQQLQRLRAANIPLTLVAEQLGSGADLLAAVTPALGPGAAT